MNDDFLDTNIFVYTFEDQAIDKRECATALVEEALTSGRAAISHQVVQETLNVFSRKLERKLSTASAQRYLELVLTPLWKIYPSSALFRRALVVRSTHGYAFYDSLIIAAALEARCNRLLTEDLQHGQVIEGLRIENPFR